MSSELLHLLNPAPALGASKSISLSDCPAQGVPVSLVLQKASGGLLLLGLNVAGVRGHSVPYADLDRDPLTGGFELGDSLPLSAVPALQNGLIWLSGDDSRDIAQAVIAQALQSVTLVAWGQEDGKLFIPDEVIKLAVGQIQLRSDAIMALRGRLASKINPDEAARIIEGARPISAAPGVVVMPGGETLFSEAVRRYFTEDTGRRADLRSETELKQQHKQTLQFAEFAGDLPVHAYTTEMLRSFRDGPLRQFPAATNHLPKEFKGLTMRETVKAIKDSGRDFPVMSLGAQQERMQLLGRFFKWAHGTKKWISHNPAAAIAGESGLTAVQRDLIDRKKHAGRRADGIDEDGKQPFTPADLLLIFGQPHYKTGNGCHLKGSAKLLPFEYWLPLMGIYSGLRIGELCQLWLTDVRQVDGVWVIDVNNVTDDKSLKNANARRLMPLHPRLIELGLLAYCDRLRGEGYLRVFPELTWTLEVRYKKVAGDKMSAMLEALGMPRDHTKTFHCTRKNANNALFRVPPERLAATLQLPYVHELVWYNIMGHERPSGETANTEHYSHVTMAERAGLVAGVEYDIGEVAPFDIEYGLATVCKAINGKSRVSSGFEDMGPLNAEIYKPS